MTTQTRAQQIVEQQVAGWNSHDAEALGAGYTEDVTLHDPVYPEPLLGRAALVKDAADFFSAFPDMTFELKRVVVDGDTIVWEGTASGTHLGPLPLPTGVVPATNRRMVFSAAGFYELDGSGRIREERRYYDVAGQLAQLGLMQ